MNKLNKSIAKVVFIPTMAVGLVVGYQYFSGSAIQAEETFATSKTADSDPQQQPETIAGPLAEKERGIAVAPLAAGWEAGSASDTITKDGYKLSWNEGRWWYVHEGRSWLYSNWLETTLLVDDAFLSGTSEAIGSGFLTKNVAESTFSINRTTNALKRSFIYLTDYQIDITQQLLEKNEIEVTYTIKNLGSVTKKIGLTQYTDMADSVAVQPVNDFKGITMVNGTNNLAVLPDSVTMPNWGIGDYSYVKQFMQYDVQTSKGRGWETGKRFRSASSGSLLDPVVNLRENIGAVSGDTAMSMKNAGVAVAPNASTSFKQKIKMGNTSPIVTVASLPAAPWILATEGFEISGTIADKDNKNYRLYLEVDDAAKTLVKLADYRDIPYDTAQNYNVRIEGKHYTPGNHKATIVGIDEYGSRSVVKTVDFTLAEVSATPIIQKVKVGDAISNTLSVLFTGIKGSNVKLKTPLAIDSSRIGFQWVEATLIDDYQKEGTVRIPVNVYDPTTTTFNDTNKMAVDAKNSFAMIADVRSAVNAGTINQFALNSANITAWNTENGTINNINVTTNNLKAGYGSYTIKFTSTDKVTPTKTLAKEVSIMVGEPQIDGWQLSDNNAFFEKEGYKIEWYGSSWWYTYNGSKWMYNTSVEANLIVDGSFPVGTSDVVTEGFLWTGITTSYFAINPAKRALKRTFIYLNKYKIDMIQELRDNNAVEITYQVTNLDSVTRKIGLSQYADTFVGSDSVPVTPINDFKGINLTYGNSSLVVIPEAKTLPNWTAGEYRAVRNFGTYSITINSSGIGWETGKQHRSADGTLYGSPQLLTENKSVNLGDSGVGLKNPGVDVLPNQTTSFKQTTKFGKLLPPEITVNQKTGSIYKDEEFEITGTVLDKDNHAFNVYVELDDPGKTLVEMKEFEDIPYGDVQNYTGKIKGKDFTVGTHNLKVLAIDEYGTRSVEYPLALTIAELSATPVVQKVKVGENLTNTVTSLFKDIKGTNITLKNPIAVDSTKVGFTWVDATLKSGTKEVAYKIPVNVYNPLSTIVDDANQLMLDAKDVMFAAADVQNAQNTIGLDALVNQTVAPKSWNMKDGTENAVVLTKNGIKPTFGSYTGTFTGTNATTLKTIQRVAKLEVGGELKFESIPNELLFKDVKIKWSDQLVERKISNWQIKILNSLATKWSLTAKAAPMKNGQNEVIPNALIYRNEQGTDNILNTTATMIASGVGGQASATVSWSVDKGVLLKVPAKVATGEYSGEITWTLGAVP